jgi:hypothetical protein
VSENELVFSPDQLNSFFTTTQNSAPRNRRVENDESLNGVAFSNTFDLEVFNAIHQIKRNRVGWCAAKVP